MFKSKLTRPEKVLLCIYELSKGTRGKLRYEDIVVGLFKKYPSEFALRGYSEYPDSEGVGKEIYRESMKRAGLIDHNNKIFSLTELGIAKVEGILGSKSYQHENITSKLPRFVINEINRIKSTQGFSLFSANDYEGITDTDFFNYFGITVRTPKSDFLMRFKTLEEVLEQLRLDYKSPLHKKIIDYHEFLMNKFQDIVQHFTINYHDKN
ncbi:MAG: hypothetical protein Q7R98_01140 [Candidatus Jorgensenbacteria bacterium]|nr:hypothetical protein [Candidatus Jorgensenbacteria bacterium]